ncbi:putative uncharacterized protein [Bacteroides sp. CAG:530]|nr:putative uncharacterized protein [Bacteroides sp. CAG:530]
MKMKKFLSNAILLILMATPLAFTSCGDDDPTEVIENPETKLDVWIEPYHVKGANADAAKSYMAQSMKRYWLQSETSTASCIQLTYVTGKGNEGILYSFSPQDGALYSIIDTEHATNSGLVIDYLKKHYKLVIADETKSQYSFISQDKAVVINVVRVSESYFNVEYTFVN